jgi:hypothetical protein
MDGFTPLERRVLDLIGLSSEQVVVKLPALMKSAVVTRRDNTGHGFYTHFTAGSASPLVWPERLITGPNIDVRVDDEVLWMGTILWLDGGVPDCLEAYQYCTPDGRHIDLKEHDLHALGLIGLREERRAS